MNARLGYYPGSKEAVQHQMTERLGMRACALLRAPDEIVIDSEHMEGM